MEVDSVEWSVRQMFEKEWAKKGKVHKLLGKHIKIGWKPVDDDTVRRARDSPKKNPVDDLLTTESPKAVEFLFMKTSERLETVHAEDRMVTDCTAPEFGSQ